MPDFKVHTQIIFSFWWFRISIFIVFLIIILISTSDILFSTFFFLALSIIIESLRINSSFKTLGFDFNKTTLLFLLAGFVYTLFSFTSLTLVVQAFNGIALFSIDDSFNLGLFFDISVLIFLLALFEEIVFRGIVFQALIQRFGKFISTLLLSFLFVAAHLAFNINTLNIFFIVNIFLANNLLSVLYLRTGSLWLPISFHFFWNLFQASILDSKVSGFYYGIQLFYTRFDSMGSLLNNGDIGFEGSLICTCVLLFSIYLVIKYFYLDPYKKAMFFRRAYLESIFSEKKLHKSNS